MVLAVNNNILHNTLPKRKLFAIPPPPKEGGLSLKINKKDRLEHYFETHKESFSPKLHKQAQALLKRSDTSLHDLTSLGKEEAWEGYNDRTEWAGLNGVREWKGVKEL